MKEFVHSSFSVFYILVRASLPLLVFGILFPFSSAFPKSLYVPDPALEDALAKALEVDRDELTEELLASRLKRFQLNGAGVRNLTGLEAATNLESLILRDNLIQDIKPITDLAYLKRLDLSGNKIRSIKDLDDLAGGGMTIRVVEIQKESETPQLLPERKEALRTELLAILQKSAKGPWQLEELRLSNNRLLGLTGIGKHLSLRHLDVSNNALIDLEGVSNLTNLEVLHLQGNQLGFVEEFEDINKNEVFDSGEPFSDLSGNGKRDHDPFGEFGNHPRLRELYLYENKISSLASMGHLPSVEVLLLGSNRLNDLSDLVGLKSLKRLSVPDNHVSDLQSISELSNLEYVHLTENRLSDLRPLRKLVLLKELHLQHNHLTDLRPLEFLTQLQVLGLAGNFLTDLNSLEGMSMLRRVTLSDNGLNLESPATREILDSLRERETRVTVGRQRELNSEMAPLFLILTRDKLSNRLLGDYLKKNRYERLLDYFLDETIPPEEKLARYNTWARTLRDGSFNSRKSLLGETN